ncbi:MULTISPECIES: 4'-phosphopantetheinyl transferase family protein [unclassified Streptomyces]|uniref:4'-phosphopantetheinyl transferase family protein n=1 Tax=unclassified Streptomyces TaxID=2593676 RepID=UPI0022B71C49|nr:MULTISPECIES: 4'-phosphopantetheinyl transferase superfamily protein [unclassified Streptomyces]MCZ7415130.1 4'-phosphopantetheinyl transferase superfamily protein [Streptomyces sp. WMMC897]MCZ7432073.1 4'-phosphopantetheinyl transferase superfamily protein [Streptomyces sp. WMMC1477]
MKTTTGAELHLHLVELSVVHAAAEQLPAALPGPERAALHGRYAPGRRRTQAEASRVLARAVRRRAPGRAHLNVSHDSGLLALVQGAGRCGVDVEDAPEGELREVAHRFCGAEDRPLLAGPGGARLLWAAKESVAKALGLGLRAGLATIHFTAHPGRSWAEVTWRGSAAGLRTRAVDLGHRHLAVTAEAVPRVVRLTRWAPRHADGRWSLHPTASTAGLPEISTSD